MKNGERPAFGRSGYELSNLADHHQQYHEEGLTKREYFAAMAMQGLIGMYSRYDGGSPSATSMLCADAVYFADELLKQLGE